MDRRVAARDRALLLQRGLTGALTVAAFTATGAIAGALDRPAPAPAPAVVPRPRRTIYVVAPDAPAPPVRPPAPVAKPPVTTSSGS